MFAREWKARCPSKHKEGFLNYLHQTGIKDTAATAGFKGAQIFTRKVADRGDDDDKGNDGWGDDNRESDGRIEVTLISYWESLESIQAFAGENIGVARLYPEDHQYELEPDNFVIHYEVVESQWI